MKVTVKARTPTEWFEVNLNTINKNLFKREKKDSAQEATRQIIREAFEVVEDNPEKYPMKFKAMIPEKIWSKKSIKKIKEISRELGNHAADWVEQALIWAQRISDGESWKKVCNDPDTENWYRLIKWKNGYWKFIGGSKKLNDSNASSYVYHYDYHLMSHIRNAVPVVISYE